MKKVIFLLPMFLLTLGVMAQNQMIEVEGKSELRILPDEALIYLSLNEKAMKVSDATNALNKKTKSIEDALKKTGLKNYEFYVDNYHVGVNRIYARNTSKDSGYVASQTIRVKVSDTGADLVKITETLHQSAVMGFNIQFSVSDQLRKDSEKVLIELAVADARRKAEIIASSLGVSDIKVQRVSYGNPQKDFFPMARESKMMMAMDIAEDRSEAVFRPEERKINDSVTIGFTFKN
ncbi:hypothetical protein A33Q_1917 [Indibacter alkaliphilus LW1]|uniref:SIMPL domain-containing protein n=1 Tax=Indibacter alkaliphilus (strain CCUG 57479 / KCTC 22604 / LW1) TaxID=1189612 RepID=S2DDM0_INDAL|nr:SIMPL domain-containing protein [Indibacter alkaliphilus]EOZ96999.1 hypothetical protein A33Q_1917 [Indibacter alkaliphilus LW1]